jgi:hypothetical protein
MIPDQEPPAVDETAATVRGRLAGLALPRDPVETGRWTWRRWGLVLFALTFVGFAGWWHLIRPVQQNLRLRLSLTNFALLYQAYHRDYGRSPKNLGDFEDFVRAQSSGRRARECEMARDAIEMARDGRLTVIWNAWYFWGGNSNEYLACESDIAQKGGLVVWTYSSVEYLSANDFARPNVRPIQAYNK